MGLLGKKDPAKKYIDLFTAAVGMGQSIEYALKQAVTAGVSDKAYPDNNAACEDLYAKIAPKMDPEQKAPLEKAYNRIKES